MKPVKQANELRCFIGYDSRESVAFHVAMHSLMRQASHPISVTPLIQDPLRRAGIYTRERGGTESTEFSLTRFLTPYLSNFEGFSIFMDSDVLIQADIWEVMLYSLTEPDKAVWVAKHDYTPQAHMKMDGCTQTSYPRKNWSSFILFNNTKCEALNLEYVNSATGLDLHRFNWIPDEQIGSLPLEWNWLVGEYEENPGAKNLHYTNGGPWFGGHDNCDHADEWKNECKAMSSSLVVA